MFFKTMSAAAAVLALCAGSAMAQDFSQEPTYGTYDVSAGFTPDPFVVNVTAGGGTDVSSVIEGCNGNVANAPDVRINYSAGRFPLTFAAAADQDVTILINGPDGTWYCNDDSGGTLNSGLTFTNPQSGQYDVWIGTFSSGVTFDAVFAVTETVNDGSAPLAENSIGTMYAAAAAPDYYASSGGDIELVSGFTPDPYQEQVMAGGGNDASAYSGGCVGFVDGQPTRTVSYTASGQLPLIFSVSSMVDTTLMIVGPNGQTYCDDDGGNGTLNPSIRFAAPLSGTYSVYVGTYSSGPYQPAMLNVSELYSE